MLNDPEAFARRKKIRDRGVIQYLRVLSAAARSEARSRAEIRRRARQLFGRLKDLPGAQLWAEDRAESARDETQLLRDQAESLARIHVDFEVASARIDILGPNVTQEQRDRLKRRAIRVLSRLFRSDRQLATVGRRLRLCRLCDRLFIPAVDKKAQQYCDTCKAQWETKQQRWYRSGGKEKMRQWRAKRKREGEGRYEETQRTR